MYVLRTSIPPALGADNTITKIFQRTVGPVPRTAVIPMAMETRCFHKKLELPEIPAPHRTALCWYRTAPRRTALTPHRTAPNWHRDAPHRTASHWHRAPPHRTALARALHVSPLCGGVPPSPMRMVRQGRVLQFVRVAPFFYEELYASLT